ncbi:MAG: TatD family hydrolase [Chthoniobacteraceae bacterium]
MNYLDAHNHLHDARLAPHRAEIFAELKRIGVSSAVVNGTRESDWDAVTALGFGKPSYGLHPWHVRDRTDRWPDTLREILVADPRAAIGEIGLDRWVEGHDLAVQTPIFIAQLDLAAELRRPATIHCIRAWGALWEVLRERDLPAGFLLHAYGGPAEMVAGFVERGAYFSFSTHFLHDRKAAQRDVFRHLPIDRVLIETDAPDLSPPEDRNPRSLPGGLNHPGNIDLAYATLGDLRGLPAEQLERIVAENFERLFGG